MRTQKDIPKMNLECKHEFKKKSFKVLFFAGGYKADMIECKKCGSWIIEDMKDHKNGKHDFSIQGEKGFMKCSMCDLSIRGIAPITYLEED